MKADRSRQLSAQLPEHLRDEWQKLLAELAEAHDALHNIPP
jgi:hypothetical protein